MTDDAVPINYQDEVRNNQKRPSSERNNGEVNRKQIFLVPLSMRLGEQRRDCTTYQTRIPEEEYK